MARPLHGALVEDMTMGAHCNRTIDWQIANLDGGLFPGAARRSSDPLITIPLDPPVARDSRASAPVALVWDPEPAAVTTPDEPIAPPDEPTATPDEPTATPDEPIPPAQAAEEEEEEEEEQPPSSRDREAETDADPVEVPAAASFKPVRLLAVVVTGGVLLGSLCAMTLTKRPMPPTETHLSDPPTLLHRHDSMAHDSTQAAAPVEAIADVAATVMPVPEARSAPAANSTGEATPHPSTLDALAARPAADVDRSAAAVMPVAISTGQATPHPSTLDAIAARPTADIDRSAAAVALAFAGRSAASCISADDTRRSVRVTVTFASSGRVTSARVDGGPLAGTQVGACIARALRSAKVGAFEGAPVTIHESIRLR